MTGTYPPTRWQVMAETGETVDETLDVSKAFDDMVRLLNKEWRQLNLEDFAVDQANAARPFVNKANDAAEDAASAIVAMVDAHRHTAKVVNLTESKRERALELLALHDTTDTYRNDPWRVFWKSHASGLAAQLHVMLAADKDDVRRTVTDLLIDADAAVLAALEVVEDGMRSQIRGRVEDWPGWEPERDRLAREAQERAERAELEALGVTVEAAE